MAAGSMTTPVSSTTDGFGTLDFAQPLRAVRSHRPPHPTPLWFPPPHPHPHPHPHCIASEMSCNARGNISSSNTSSPQSRCERATYERGRRRARREGGQLSFRRVCCSAPICHSLTVGANERDLCRAQGALRCSLLCPKGPKLLKFAKLDTAPSDATPATSTTMF